MEGPDLRPDLFFLRARLAFKLEQMRDDLGSVGAVLTEQVGDAMLGKRTGIDDAEIDRARSKPATRVLQVERRLRETLARCHERLQASIDDLGLTPGRVERGWPTRSSSLTSPLRRLANSGYHRCAGHGSAPRKA